MLDFSQASTDDLGSGEFSRHEKKRNNSMLASYFLVVSFKTLSYNKTNWLH